MLDCLVLLLSLDQTRMEAFKSAYKDSFTPSTSVSHVYLTRPLLHQGVDVRTFLDALGKPELSVEKVTSVLHHQGSMFLFLSTLQTRSLCRESYEHLAPSGVDVRTFLGTLDQQLAPRSQD